MGNKVALTEPHNAIPANQQQGAFVLIHRTRGRGGGGVKGVRVRETVNLTHANMLNCLTNKKRLMRNGQREGQKNKSCKISAMIRQGRRVVTRLSTCLTGNISFAMFQRAKKSVMFCPIC